VSKRSYRRLALVAGAAMAAGSMAPALAANVNAGGSSSASVDLSGVTPGLPSVGGLVPTQFVGGLTGMAIGTVQSAPAMVVTGVSGLMNGALGIAGGLTNPATSLDVAGNADLGLNALSAGVAVNGVADAASGLVDGVVAAPGAVVGTARGVAGPIVGTAVGVAGTAVGMAQSAPGIALGPAGGLLNGGLLGSLTDVLGGSVQGSLGANLAGSL